MKNRYRTPVHKKKTIPTIMILALLAPILLTPSFVFAEDLTPADKQTDVSQTQENTATTESTLESSTPLESSTFEEPTVSSTPVENDTTISTSDSTTTEETAATLTIPRADVITIADTILKQAILSTLGLPAGSELTQADMDRLTNFSLNSAQISSLSGIEHATNLSSIYMNTTNNITDFSPLEQLSFLTFVTLQTKSLTSANFPDLSNNSGLTNLGLGSTSIDDDILPKIAQLTSLTRIYMDSNMNITTIAPFKALPNLKSLSVQFCGITDFTVINEFPALNDLAAFGQNTGRNDLPTTIGRSSLAYDFDQETLFLPFSMMPNRMTNFDGYVPPFTTSNSASNTYLDFNGIQLPANRLQITDEGITISGVTEDEFANLSTFEYNARLNNLAGSYAQPPGFAFYAISGGTYLHQFNVLDDGKPVTIHYQDTDGKLLLPSETRSGLVGQSFDIPVQEIPYYELIETKGDTFGTFTDQEQSITFIYKKISAPIIEKMGKVTVYYVDINNETIQDEFVQTGTIGDPFKTEKVAINGFTLKDVKGATTGLFTEEDQEVTYIYAKDETKTEPTTDSSKTNDTTPNKPAANDSAIKSPSTNDKQLSKTSATASNDKPLSKTSATASTEKKFPATGERSNHTWLILGLVFIGFVNYQYVLKKVRQTK